MSRRGWWAAAGVVLCLAVAGYFQFRHAPQAGAGKARGGTSPSGRGAAVAARSRPASALPPPRDVEPRAAELNASSTMATNVQLVDHWFDITANYRERDRAAVIEEATQVLIDRGPTIVSELEGHLERTSIYRQTERATTFHALGRLAQSLRTSDDPGAGAALEVIHQLANDELATPELIEPDPAMGPDALPVGGLHELVHRGVLLERDGRLWQSTLLGKLAAIQTLTDAGDVDALTRLRALQAEKGNSIGVRFAVDRAIHAVERRPGLPL